jgi:hypothetical protein
MAADVKHPDNMNRKEKLQMIAALGTYQEASNWWLRHAGNISRKAFDKARGYE